MDSDLDQLYQLMNQSLSANITRNLSLTEDLDERSEAIVKTIEETKEEYLKNVNEFDLKDRNSHLNKINDLFECANGLAEDKIRLCDQSLHLIDKYDNLLVKQMVDLETRLKEIELQEKRPKEVKQKISNTFATEVFEEIEPKSRRMTKAIKCRPKKVLTVTDFAVNSETTNLIVSRRSRRTKHTQNSRFNVENYVFTPIKPKVVPKEQTESQTQVKEYSELVSQPTIGSMADSLSMPPNPSELVFCVCKEISFGEMIRCDNNECYVQWFHFGCVGLRDKPKGKWFCQKCLSLPIDN